MRKKDIKQLIDGLVHNLDDIIIYNPETGDEVPAMDIIKDLFNEVMNLGMDLRQSQYLGYSDKSGNVVLDEWIKVNFS